MTQAIQGRMQVVDEQFLQERLAESLAIIRKVVAMTEKPLIVQFSGGRDSMCLLGLVREVTDQFVCAYMATGLEFSGVIQFVKETCEKLGAKLIISQPGLYKGNIFKRIEKFHSFPNISRFNGGGSRLWCCRDLKLRPQKLLLQQLYGKGTFYKLEGIRRFESTRRKYIYKPYSETMMREDSEQKGSFEVFPVLNWSDGDVLNYLEMAGLPTSGLYKRFGVSGCSWCPFYPSTLYYDIIKQMPEYELYNRVIRWEEKLGEPSVAGNIYLRDIKRAVLEGKPCPEAVDVEPQKSPCTMEFQGEVVPTCSIYGHFYLQGKCFRCEQTQESQVGELDA